MSKAHSRRMNLAGAALKSLLSAILFSYDFLRTLMDDPLRPDEEFQGILRRVGFAGEVVRNIKNK